MARPVLHAEHLRKTYDGVTDVLHDVNLEVGRGETVVVVGRNGSGKTTLLNLLGGMDAPTGGRVEINGRDLGRASEAELAKVRLHQIGFVFQTHNLIEDLTARQNVELPLRLAGKRDAERIDQLLRSFELDGLASRRPAELSVGQSQRVAIARALANGPSVILADEPAAALDERGRTALEASFSRAVQEFGVGLVVTAVVADEWRGSSRALLLENGVLGPHRVGGSRPATG